MASLLEAALAFRQALSCLVLEDWAASDCVRLAEELATTEKACAAARLLVSARAVGSGAHREGGCRDGAEWMARQVGSSRQSARRALATAGALEALAATREAFVAGELSLEQAGEIARLPEIARSPELEGELLALARTNELRSLRERSRELCAALVDREELHARQRRARHFRHFRDGLGMVCFSGALCPTEGVGFLHRLELAAARARRAARRDGGALESFEAYAADELVALSSSSGGAPPPGRAELVIVCDLRAWRRGHPHEGEPCHLLEGGPLSVPLATELAQDAFVKAVTHDGVFIQQVKHFGRHLPAELRTALDLGPVPAFSGAACARCGRRFGLEYDHVEPFANKGPTSYENLQALCWSHHRDKTEEDRQRGLLGPAARRRARPAGPAPGEVAAGLAAAGAEAATERARTSPARVGQRPSEQHGGRSP